MSGVGLFDEIAKIFRQGTIMSNIEEIKSAIESLPATDYARFRQWFIDRDWAKWDKQVKEDSQSGKLDFLISEAIAEKNNGTLKEL